MCVFDIFEYICLYIQLQFLVFYFTGIKLLDFDVRLPFKSKEDLVGQFRDFVEKHPNIKLAVVGMYHEIVHLMTFHITCT